MTIKKGCRAVAVPTPLPRASDAVESIHGFMRGSVILPNDIDLTAPVIDEPSTNRCMPANFARMT